MISRVSQVTLPVAGRERAEAFWTDGVAFEVHAGAANSEERWVEIAPAVAGLARHRLERGTNPAFFLEDNHGNA